MAGAVIVEQIIIFHEALLYTYFMGGEMVVWVGSGKRGSQGVK